MTNGQYLAKRPGVKCARKTLSASRAWRSARIWGAQPGRWLINVSLKDREDGPYVEDAAPGAVQVEQSKEKVEVGRAGSHAIYEDRFVYRVILAQTQAEIDAERYHDRGTAEGYSAEAQS